MRKNQKNTVDMNELYDKMQESALLDLRKPEFTKFERANMLSEYMDRHQLDVRQMAKKCGIPHTTLFGWLKYNEITETQFNEFQKEGISRTQITNALKSKDSITNLKQDKKALLVEEIKKLNYKVLDLRNTLNAKVVSTELYNATQELQSSLNDFSLNLHQLLHPKK